MCQNGKLDASVTGIHRDRYIHVCESTLCLRCV